MKTAIAPCLISLLLAAGCTAREEPVQAAGSETAPAPAVTPPARTLEGKAIEDYGAVGDYTGAEFYNALTIIPLGGEGDGTSKVIYTGGGDVFDAGWVGRELVVFRCHHNPGAYPETRNYFPNLLTCRYVKVVKVIDARTLEVDLSINGGNRDFKPDGVTPSMTGASGYFFTNNREAFRKAFTDPERPEALLLENGRTYVVRGGWDCAVPKNLVVTTRDPGGPKAAIKLSFEDAFSTDPHGQGAGRCPSFAADYGSAAYFRLEDGEDYSIAFRNIDLLPPDTIDAVGELRKHTDTPVCVGFGIARPDMVEEVCRVADGAIVGSAIIHRITDAMDKPQAELVKRVGDFVTEMLRPLG